MSEQSPRLVVSFEDGLMVVELAEKKLLDEVAISRIGEQVNALAARGPNPRMVVDFSHVAQMSSSALGMLITLHKRIRERNGQLRLCGIQPGIYEVFVITRLNEIFTILPSRQEAMDSLR
jgi:anti-sigma B factor antagonist